MRSTISSEIKRFAGFGLGLRSCHYSDFIERDIAVDFVEIISENYMIDGGRPLAVLDQIRARYPMAMHGVSLSIGSSDGLNADYLKRLRTLVERVEPLWVSDHLCFTGLGGHNSHDLLPLPYSTEALQTVCDNIGRVQDSIGRAMLFENPSSYIEFPNADMSEWEFLSEMTKRSGCYLLLDVNNIYVSACNHGFAAEEYLRALPIERVRQIHLAGHSQGQDMLIDTHDHAVCNAVWDLYQHVMIQLGAQLGDVAVMIERDDDIPPLDDLLAELDHARRLAEVTAVAA